MKTVFRLSKTEKLNLLIQSIKFYINYKLGNFLLNRIKLINRLNDIKLSSDYSIISKHQKNHLLTQESKLDENKIALKIKGFRVNSKNLNDPYNPYSKICYAFIKFINNCKSIKKVCNVGSRIDFVSDYLSKKYLNKTFISIDFQKNLHLQNKSLNIGKNWKFQSKYIIDLLNKNFKADALIMSFTACKMTPNEFKNFLNKSKKIKFFIIIEPYFPYYLRKNKIRLNRPEEIPSNEIIIGSKEILNPNLPTFHFHHNYLSQFKKIGFEVLESTVTPNKNNKGAEHLMVFKKKK